MAIELKYSIEENPDRLGINFTEKTGAYSSGNLGGWGAPNEVIADATDAIVSINARGSSDIYSISLFPTLPTSSKEIENLIPATSFGFASGEKITDGIYQIAYTVNYVDNNGNEASSTDSFYFAFVEGIRCCIANIRSRFHPPEGECNCTGEDKSKFYAAEALYNSICGAVSCDKLDKTQEIIDYLQRYCECNCTTCN